MAYRDRPTAGNALAAHLHPYTGDPNAVVLGLLRGGIPVAACVAAVLRLPLDALSVRKLGVPWAPEVAFGALGPGGAVVLNEEIAARLDPTAMHAVLRRERTELDRRERRYRLGRPPPTIDGRTAIIVDDGLATGATARVAVDVLHRMGARRVVFAAPVGSAEGIARVAERADEVVCPLRPATFDAVSRHYDDFRQVSDLEILRHLAIPHD
ncbi:hypothetical protein Val02_76820 [Virgisporangium aliadipatigenens]|uniref:Phosphoribosyltransferase domain-containing protein n=1 Tax=Virgisporangium aliadipatigenens TaxID=741659 RepID=A0A8J3YVY6_9ACTN|nr:phosphoribosyltransferase family protein [Virgisporangium aliadipatigenens]GIJ50796.1 hypothetical protein Val02_76820 [Virgisporangium aliadipatigenens]